MNCAGLAFMMMDGHNFPTDLLRMKMQLQLKTANLSVNLSVGIGKDKELSNY